MACFSSTHSRSYCPRTCARGGAFRGWRGRPCCGITGCIISEGACVSEVVRGGRFPANQFKGSNYSLIHHISVLIMHVYTPAIEASSETLKAINFLDRAAEKPLVILMVAKIPNVLIKQKIALSDESAFVISAVKRLRGGSALADAFEVRGQVGTTCSGGMRRFVVCRSRMGDGPRIIAIRTLFALHCLPGVVAFI